MVISSPSLEIQTAIDLFQLFSYSRNRNCLIREGLLSSTSLCAVCLHVLYFLFFKDFVLFLSCLVSISRIALNLKCFASSEASGTAVS